MDPLDTLQTLSEIGIAITGFAGVVSVLDKRAHEDWDDFDRVNLYTLLTWSLATVFLAQVPGVLHGLGDFAPHPWRASHALFAIYHSWVFHIALRAMYAEAGYRDRLTLTLLAIGIGMLALEIASAIGLAGTLAPTFYVIAVLWFLFLSASRFILLVTRTFPPPDIQP
jgi:hypothetical protein